MLKTEQIILFFLASSVFPTLGITATIYLLSKLDVILPGFSFTPPSNSDT